jgi:fibronectin type 3 domain-containing protein
MFAYSLSAHSSPAFQADTPAGHHTVFDSWIFAGMLLLLMFLLSGCGSHTPAPPALPAAPTGLSAAPGDSKVLLSWAASATASGFSVLRSIAAGGSYTVIGSATTTTYTDSGVTNGTTYYYVVQATNSAGASGYSNQASATPAGPPSPPAKVTASAGNQSVALSWSASAGAIGYNVLRSTSSGGPYAAVASAVASTTYTDSSVINGTTYYYVIQATNGTGTSGNSDQAAATPSAPASPPPPPANLIAAAGNQSVALSWSASAGATSYNVLRSTSAGTSYSSIATAIAATAYIDTGVANGTTYYYVVQANNSAGASTYSTQVSATPNGVIQARAGDNLLNFFVYFDQDSGRNHGSPSGFYASAGNLDTIHLNMACIDDPASSSGCYPSSATSVLDVAHGTVVQIVVDPQTPGNFVGFNFEEPENWGLLSTNTGSPRCGAPYSCHGYNLTGATTVSFLIRSPNQGRVQFTVGQSGGQGCTTSFTQPLPSTWTAMSIRLGPPDLSCSPDLSAMNLLFGIATNDQYAANGAIVLLDNIRFDPLPARANQASETLSLPVDTQTFGTIAQTASTFPPDQVNRNAASSYEASLATMAMLSMGDANNALLAGKIVDALDYALYHDNEAWYIPTAPGALNGCYSGIRASQCGLHNAYSAGDIAIYNDQHGTAATAKAGDIRLAGFSCGATSPTGYCLVLDGATGGNNAWAGLALLDEYLRSGNPNDVNDAIAIGNWIIANLADTRGTGYGGYFVGFPDQGVSPPKPLNLGKSTENNADIAAFLSALSVLDSGHASKWIAAANVAGDFVMQMYAPDRGAFNVGTVPPGASAVPGVCPTGPQRGNDVINTCDFLDSNTFATLAMAGSPRYTHFVLSDGTAMDWNRPIQYVLNHFAQTITAGGQTFQGFDLVPTPISGANGIAWEFTAQAVETMRYVDQVANQTTFESQADFYLQQLQLAVQAAPFGDGNGLVASTLQDGSTLPPPEQCLDTPFQNCPAERVGIAATAWMMLAAQKVDPLVGFGSPVINNPLPAITGLSPSSAAGGSAAQTLVISGTNFVPAATVTYNGALHPSVFTSSTQLSIALSAADQSSAGLYPVAVTNPPPGGGSSSPVEFIVNNPLPSISSLIPATIMARSPAQTLTITGANMVPASGVTLNGVSYPVTYVGPSTLTVSLGAADLASAGVFPVIVVNPPPGGGTSNSAELTINNPVPTISSVSPSFIAADSLAQSLTIDGTNFIPGSTVTFNGVLHAATLVNGGVLTIQLSAADKMMSGNYSLVVTNPSPGGGASNALSIAIGPARIDFSTLPAALTTNLGSFVVTGTTDPGNSVLVNGASLTLDNLGNFAAPFSLSNGPNRIQLDIGSATGTQSFVKTITFDPSFSTAGKTLVYVSSVAPELSGTIVIDPDNRTFLGFIPNRHVRGVSPDGKQIYMEDRTVISADSHQDLSAPLSPLAFSIDIPSDGFLVSPDGATLYSGDEALSLSTNQVAADRLPVSIETGWAWAGPNQGGPAISPDGRYIYCGCGGQIQRIDTADHSIIPIAIPTIWLSDLTVSPDGKLLLVSAYWGDDQIYDATSFELLMGPFNFGDFSGQAVVSSDGKFAIFGNAGNPQLQGGQLAVVNLASQTEIASVPLDLSDHLVISDQNLVFASSGDTPGIDEFILTPGGVLQRQAQFVLGVNQFVPAYGAPQRDEIEKIVLRK